RRLHRRGVRLPLLLLAADSHGSKLSLFSPASAGLMVGALAVYSGDGMPCCKHAAFTVLTSRQAMVMGPTPPGTGVMAAAFSATSQKATSPTSLVLPSPASRRLMPTSITTAPSFTQEPFTISGLPTAATRISAVRHSAGRSRVLEWAMVTVQFSFNNNW